MMPRSSTRSLLLAALLLGCGLAAACGPSEVGDARTFLIYDHSPDSGDYELFERDIETLQHVGRAEGELARLRAGGQIQTNSSSRDSESDIADSIRITDDSEPRLDYSVRDDDTVVAWDFDSTIMLTLYHHIERANEYFQALGVDESRMGKVPVYYDVRLQVFIPIDLLTDNAAYAFTLDAFLIPPRLLFKDVPLAANRGVIVHEYSHLVFNRIVHDDARAPTYLAEDWPEPAINRMRSIDEGVADIFAGLQTDDPNFIGPSISEELFDIDRDLSKERHYDEDLKNAVETKTSSGGGPLSGEEQYNPYKLGSVIASTVWTVRSATDISDDRLGEAVVDTLREFSGGGPEGTTTARFFNLLDEQLPSEIRGDACDIYHERLDAIREDLTCDD